ncbi:MAG: hypothetical protein AAGM67_22110, partial [Bacteroidota bacterium]
KKKALARMELMRHQEDSKKEQKIREGLRKKIHQYDEIEKKALKELDQQKKKNKDSSVDDILKRGDQLLKETF